MPLLAETPPPRSTKNCRAGRNISAAFVRVSMSIHHHNAGREATQESGRGSHRNWAELERLSILAEHQSQAGTNYQSRALGGTPEPSH